MYLKNVHYVNTCFGCIKQYTMYMNKITNGKHLTKHVNYVFRKC